MIITLLIFLAILLTLVISHEAGHFFVARKTGVAVEEFGFGIPPRIGKIQRGETAYSFNALPFGGFVKLRGEEGDGEHDPKSFGAKKWYQKSAILLAGVGANILLAYVALSLVSIIGIPVAVPDDEAKITPDAKITVTEIAMQSPADDAGFMAGDTIQSVAGVEPTTAEDAQRAITARAGVPTTFVVKRNGAEITLTATPRQAPPAGEGPLGIALSLTRIQKTAWYKAPIVGAELSFNILRNTVSGFAGLIKAVVKKETSRIQVAGPVGIFSLTTHAKNSGVAAVLIFTAILSINLAIINVLPIPGLDGGRLLFVLFETARGKKISSHVSALVHGIGLAALLILMLIITYKDIARLF